MTTPSRPVLGEIGQRFESDANPEEAACQYFAAARASYVGGAALETLALCRRAVQQIEMIPLRSI